VKTIKLTKGYETIVDDDDFEWLKKFRWSVNLSNPNAPRGIRNTGGRKHSGVVYIHREIARARQHEQVDHINGNPLDNRKENLRLCTAQENNWNKGLGIKNKTGYKGVFDRSKDNKKRPWQSKITINRKSLHLGFFETKEKAALAYNNAAKKHYGDFARLNEIR
jgi:hypothetical protein